ncbi:MAG: hypothetical protein DM484_01405 [Candidatus Methylumidiphilus alinenensis]|uniref:Uncharacterized protein n=1 Tax=Candidatus Methylumidiphilus alinenensis TaxID=2202197 RepID=A0A2W4RNW5_9GAMM|nr:MAG: hypothetical protein DM484_01405 [Candidatus Methylumidiphilus alinenensis]
MKTLNCTLAESECKLLLEAIASLETQWGQLCAQSDDPDEISDFGNDLIELRLLAKSFSEQAVSVFGENVLHFGREQL